MNLTLKATLDMIRTISFSSQIKTKRNFTDFLADRIVQASSEACLMNVMEKLAGMVDSQPSEVYQPILASFLKACNNDDSVAVLNWLRQYPRIAAMLTALKAGEYEKLISTLELDINYERESGTALLAKEAEIGITLTCLSPLAHGSDTKAGNATLFRRMNILSTTGAVLSLPFYAGNALRGLMRDLLADDFIKALGLVPRRDNPPVALWFFHALYAGGALEENSEAAKKIKKEIGGNGSVKAQGIHEFRDTLPGLSLLGCALGNRILCGRAKFADFRPACKQWGNGDIDVSRLYEWLYLTRREDHEDHENHSGMIANTECLRVGTVLHGGIDIDVHASALERSALGRGVELLIEKGAIGAENRRGFGHVSVETNNIPDPEPYKNYLTKEKDVIIDYLSRLGAINVSEREKMDT